MAFKRALGALSRTFQSEGQLTYSRNVSRLGRAVPLVPKLVALPCRAFPTPNPISFFSASLRLLHKKKKIA